MNLVLALLVVVGFAATIECFDLPDRARTVGRRSRRSLSVLRDNSLRDREKEEALQQQARQLFRLLGVLVGGSVLALGGPLGAVWLLGRAGIGSFWGTIGVIERLDFLAGVTVVGGIGYALFRRFYASSRTLATVTVRWTGFSTGLPSRQGRPSRRCQT